VLEFHKIFHNVSGKRFPGDKEGRP
jgi:hypothetical protein